MPIQDLTGQTRLVPILADPIDHVKAPQFYNPAFAARGLDWCMVAMGIRPACFAAMLDQLAQVSNVQGLNVTIPHKAAALAQCQSLGPEARLTGVANTLRREANGTWSGESFDGAGFLAAAMAQGVLRVDGPVAIVGTGGAGTAIAFALAAAGVPELQLLNRDPRSARALALRLKTVFPQTVVRTDASRLLLADLVVNATSLGLHAGDALPFDPSQLHARAAVFDIIAARDTELMAACQARGLQVIGGRPMIDHQMAAQIDFWQNTFTPTELTE